MTAAAVNSIVPYFGAKRVLTPRIVAEFGPHTAYWEPFCGSLADAGLFGEEGQ